MVVFGVLAVNYSIWWKWWGQSLIKKELVRQTFTFSIQPPRLMSNQNRNWVQTTKQECVYMEGCTSSQQAFLWIDLMLQLYQRCVSVGTVWAFCAHAWIVEHLLLSPDCGCVTQVCQGWGAWGPSLCSEPSLLNATEYKLWCNQPR